MFLRKSGKYAIRGLSITPVWTSIASPRGCCVKDDGTSRTLILLALLFFFFPQVTDLLISSRALALTLPSKDCKQRASRPRWPKWVFRSNVERPLYVCRTKIILYTSILDLLGQTVQCTRLIFNFSYSRVPSVTIIVIIIII